MKVFVTGATGFIGGRLVETLQGRPEISEINCLVRDPSRLKLKSNTKIQIHRGDIVSKESMRDAMAGADVVYHLAAYYELGIAESEVAAMEKINVDGTRNVLSLAHELRVKKTIYVSTVFALGATDAELADETFQHRGTFTCHYERTKFEAHKIAEQFAREGLPLIIVLPAAVYGPNDPSSVGDTMKLLSRGKLPATVSGTAANKLTLVHVDDVVDLILLATEKGKLGESYIAAGGVMTMGEMMSTVAQAAGRKPPRLSIPLPVARFTACFDERISRLRGRRPLLSQEGLNTITNNFAATAEKAKRELGFLPRPNAQGLAETVSWILRN